MKAFFQWIGRIVSAPFRLLWAGLTQIANLSSRQIKSLVTVAFLGGIVALSAENWGITFMVDHVVDAEHKHIVQVLDFLTERMRYISGLQAWFALALTAVILGADYIEAKVGGNSFRVGGDGKDEKGG